MSEFTFTIVDAWRFLSWVASKCAERRNKFECVATPSGIAWHAWDRPVFQTVFVHGEPSGWVVQRLDTREIVVGLCEEFWRADMARVYIEDVGLENVTWRKAGVLPSESLH